MVCTDNRDVSVVILTKNSAKTLQKCLDSVLVEKIGEIIAVDRLSSDGTITILTRYGVKILRDSIGSLGYSRQLGVEAAKGLYVMFVDSDVELSPGCIARLRFDLEQKGWVGVHARLLSADNVTYWQRAEAENISPTYDTGKGPKQVNYINTIAALFTRDVLLEHPFDPNLRDAAEDVDLCHRLTEHKHELGISNAVAYHNYLRDATSFVRHRFRYGLGGAQLGLKYRSFRILLEPMEWSIFKMIQCVMTNKISLLPYWLTRGTAEFLGVIAGLSSARHQCTRD